MLNTSPMKIVSITNKFSTTNMTLPQFKNTDLEIGRTKAINSSILKIRVPKLVHGSGSIIELGTFVNGSDPTAEGHVYAVFDQGSTIGGVIYSQPPSVSQLLSELYLNFAQIYYIIFFVGFVAFIIVWKWIWKRKVSNPKVH